MSEFKVPQDAARFKDWADKACVDWPQELTMQAAAAFEGLQTGDRAAFDKFESDWTAHRQANAQ